MLHTFNTSKPKQHYETHDIQRGLLLQEDETHEEGNSTDLCPYHDLRPNFRNPHAVSDRTGTSEPAFGTRSPRSYREVFTRKTQSPSRSKIGKGSETQPVNVDITALQVQWKAVRTDYNAIDEQRRKKRRAGESRNGTCAAPPRDRSRQTQRCGRRCHGQSRRGVIYDAVLPDTGERH